MPTSTDADSGEADGRRRAGRDRRLDASEWPGRVPRGEGRKRKEAETEEMAEKKEERWIRDRKGRGG